MNKIRFKFNKLVRDKVPTILESQGIDVFPKENHFSKDAIKLLLNDKLSEEVLELQDAKTKEQIIEEMADVFEILRAMQEFYGISSEDVINKSKKKVEERGTFKEKKFILYIEAEADNPHLHYFKERPLAYPEDKTTSETLKLISGTEAFNFLKKKFKHLNPSDKDIVEWLNQIDSYEIKTTDETKH